MEQDQKLNAMRKIHNVFPLELLSLLESCMKQPITLMVNNLQESMSSFGKLNLFIEDQNHPWRANQDSDLEFEVYMQ